MDTITLNFSPQSLQLLNVVLGIVVFGIAIDLKIEDFKRVLLMPRAVVAGLAAQFLLLPAATFLLIQILRPAPEFALGMLLVSSCPGGNISNFVTHISRGNSALSVSMTAISSLAAIIMTPLNFSFWGQLDPELAPLLQEVALSFGAMFKMVAIMLGLPLALGMLIAAKQAKLASTLRTPLRWFSFLAFFGFVIAASANNLDAFRLYLGLVIGLVATHNLLAFCCGYSLARLCRLPPADTRAVTVEVGIQNSGLGLILIFNFFGGMGGMALIAAAWGIWHIFSGSLLAAFWSRRPLQIAETGKL
ncbi:MAG: bile acid:sodium symporter family protein [Oceanococcus sp.]